ncbi:hypothetical protein FACS189472_19020 [Alphaproteobacteria bacterium]|nr:hypothetical protein FACS189472_19020 [Alphaproteobacteria bacterium]
MSLSSLAPSLELKLQKQKSTHLDNTSSNTNSIIVNNFLEIPSSPRPASNLSISPLVLTPKAFRPDALTIPVKEEPKDILMSPSTAIIEKFKDLLIEYQTELLLNDYELICNIAERGKNIMMRESQLVNIIKCLTISYIFHHFSPKIGPHGKEPTFFSTILSKSQLSK